MFESVTPSTPPSSQPPAPPTTPLEVHSMPERFLGSKSPLGKAPAPVGGKGSSRKLIIAIGIIVVVGLGVAAALLFTGVLNKNAANTNNVNLVTNAPATNVNVNANGNANVKVNTNSNSNANANANVNTNANVNVNANTNGAANANANVNSNPTAPNSADADKDGLTDAEEPIFTTNPSVADTDGDGFPDGSEVKLGYNPKGSGKIAASSLILSFTNPLYGASVLYPKGWTIVARSSTEELLSNPLGDETVSFAVEDNIARLTAKQWYITKAPSVDASSLTDATTWDGKSTGIVSPDGLAYYFANGNQVYIISLSYGLKPAVDSRTSFEMIARSLVVDPTKVNVNANTGLNANTNTASQGTKTIYDVRSMIDSYYSANKTLPANLSALVPTYTASIPPDESGGQYTYTITTGGKNYDLCGTLSSGVVMCIHTSLYVPTNSNTNSATNLNVTP